MERGPYYKRALVSLQTAHEACFKNNVSVLGMSTGPFSGVNEVLGMIVELEEENLYLKTSLETLINKINKQNMENNHVVELSPSATADVHAVPGATAGDHPTQYGIVGP